MLLLCNKCRNLFRVLPQQPSACLTAGFQSPPVSCLVYFELISSSRSDIITLMKGFRLKSQRCIYCTAQMFLSPSVVHQHVLGGAAPPMFCRLMHRSRHPQTVPLLAPTTSCFPPCTQREKTFYQTFRRTNSRLFLFYRNTSNPQPAMAVKSLGAKSRVGLMAQPLLLPMETPIRSTSAPTARGSPPGGAGLFF